MVKIGRLYENRKLSNGFPDLKKEAHNTFINTLNKRADNRAVLEKQIRQFTRLIDLDQYKNILLIGCGPKPVTLQYFLEKKFEAHGVEPIPSFVESARKYLNAPERVARGSAEQIPFPDGSQHIIFFDSVLEHVDSPVKSLEEMYRVLAPGGIAHIITTNRLKFSLFGQNSEFNVRFYNWFPKLVKECFVFQHLHYDPRLANFTQRPAVHWFSYSDLCNLGRQAGFAHFYSNIDLLKRDDPGIAKSWLRKFLLKPIQLNPWLRALALTQKGGHIIMLKRFCD
jgi:ubiquinone/menaquinone biosynthesis C-methylase UbiE